MTDRTAEEAKREALIARCERDAHNLTFPFMAPTIKEQHEAAQTLMDCAAVLQWQAEQQKGEALPKIASEVRIMLGSATELFDGIGDIVGYQIKTGALHRILGLLSGAGHPVAIAAKNQSVALAASPHGVPPGYVLVPRPLLESMATSSTDANARGFAAAALSSLPQAPQGEQG